MKPGQVAVQLGTWIGALPNGIAGQLGLGVEVPLGKRIGIGVLGGIQRDADDGALNPRDTIVSVTWIPVNQKDLVVRLRPGLSLPTGGIGQDLFFTPLSTSSVDPWLSGDIVYGTTWLLAANAVARVPLYDGWDLRRQGPFLRTDLRGARRLGKWVPSAGLSIARQAPSVPRGAAPDFADVAATAGVLGHLGDRWSVGVQLRAPLWVSEGAPRVIAGGASLRCVVGKAASSDDDDEHH